MYSLVFSNPQKFLSIQILNEIPCRLLLSSTAPETSSEIGAKKLEFEEFRVRGVLIISRDDADARLSLLRQPDKQQFRHSSRRKQLACCDPTPRAGYFKRRAVSELGQTRSVAQLINRKPHGTESDAAPRVNNADRDESFV